jgi:GGDEF domain-containing protein
MRPDDILDADFQPQTRSELQAWVHEHLQLTPAAEAALLAAIDAVFMRHEHLWQESKHEAIQALSAGFAEKMARVKTELSAKDATVSSISLYFESLVAELTDRTHRDPKTKLMNFARFTEQLESFLGLEQRGRWCAVGLVDITGFKRYNDTLGHAVGDRIIERVARLLREQVRSDDLIAQERPASPNSAATGNSRSDDGAAGVDPTRRELHARFGGDEFCFMIPDLAECSQAHAIGERFREAVDHYDWALEDPRLGAQPVAVDVGVVCLWLGRLVSRRFVARRLAADLIQRADKLMYEAKFEHAARISFLAMKIDKGALVEVGEGERPSS